MTMYMLILSVVVVGVILSALGYTLSVSKTQRKLKGELDTPIPGKVQEGIYTKNPIFYAFIAFFAITLLLILYMGLRW